MDKRKPTYDLASFKASFSSVEKLNATIVALQGARSLGITVTGMVSVIQTMERKHFYKSMTSNNDHTVWQDVYHVPHDENVIYIKFIADVVTEFRLLSFKEK
ncbi:type II toxin-antitoxin system MqsR family toxin (plasmid) [Skermanella sp. TT6]|uniref:Type II toxin-antitoxin system MqsR family toxin n=1 Tax=Skermanella cutis TaxID=2775420 RepID=A0ABX7BHZ3_9PROT|nr:type II toxin-antitoxin system MqsR family toxin [Skermanella sp. TT6]QQP94013.1 type II toxin-antitoxin system MqsR family toxin [Skermanella sp. TT6]